MRIALTDFHLRWGGQAEQVFLLARGLHQRGHDVRVFAPPTSDLVQRSAAAGVPADTSCRFPRGFRPLKLLGDLRSLRAALAQQRTEVVHCHGSQDTWLAAVARRLHGLPFALVRTKHNRNPIRPHTANRWLYGHALDRLIAIAEPIRRQAVEQGGVPAGRTAVVHPALPEEFGQGIPPDPGAAVRTELDIPADAPLIGQVGRLDPVKGQEDLLRALERIRESFPGAYAVFVGTGGDYDRLQGVRDALGLGDCVRFTLFREDVARLTSAFSVAVCASRQEGWGLSVMEAMALGVPVVATKSGGPAEILDHGALGALVPPRDPPALADAVCAVLRARGTSALDERLARARNRVREAFSLPAAVARTERIYEEALAARC